LGKLELPVEEAAARATLRSVGGDLIIF